MEIVIIITLAIVSGILTIGMINMQKEIDRQKSRATEWKEKYLQEAENSIKEYNLLEKEVMQKDKKIEKTLIEVEQYKAKYNEILKQNKELLLKIEENKVAAQIVEKPVVKSTRKPRKKKGDNE